MGCLISLDFSPSSSSVWNLNCLPKSLFTGLFVVTAYFSETTYNSGGKSEAECRNFSFYELVIKLRTELISVSDMNSYRLFESVEVHFHVEMAGLFSLSLYVLKTIASK